MALLRHFDKLLNDNLDIALKIADSVRGFITSPVADLLGTLLPPATENVLRQKISSALDAVIQALTIAEECKQCTDTAARLACFIRQLQQYDPELQNTFLVKFAALLAANLDDNRLKQQFYDLFAQAKVIVRPTSA